MCITETLHLKCLTKLNTDYRSNTVSGNIHIEQKLCNITPYISTSESISIIIKIILKMHFLHVYKIIAHCITIFTATCQTVN